MKYRNKLYRSIFLLFLCAMVFSRYGGIGSAADTPSTPKNNPVLDRAALNPSSPIVHLLDFYKKFISRVDGDRCPMYPSCTAYSKQAFQKHGLFMGWIMTSDRLLRCGRDEVHHAPQVWVNGQKRTYDPLTNNDFWR
jgi:putative component of membrane protein insertase Oxa1/YidC/SpoIIIJ protein YidD